MTNENNENQTPQDEPQSPPETETHASQEPAPQQPAAPVQQTQAPSPGGGGDVGKKIQDMANMQVGGFSLCKIVALGGAALLFLSFFLPWWGISQEEVKDVKRSDVQDELKEANDYGTETFDFMGDVFSTKALRKFGEEYGKEKEASLSAFGWNLSRGIVTFIFSFLIAGAIVVTMFVPAVRAFAPFILLVAVILAFVVFILTLTVWFGTPGKDLDYVSMSLTEIAEIDQGVSFGTFVAMLGALGVLAGAGYEAVMGMMGFLKAQQSA